MNKAGAVRIIPATTAPKISDKVTHLLTDDAARAALANAALTHTTQENELFEKLLSSLALTFEA